LVKIGSKTLFWMPQRALNLDPPGLMIQGDLGKSVKKLYFRSLGALMPPSCHHPVWAAERGGGGLLILIMIELFALDENM